MTKLYNISELSKILNLIDPVQETQNHILRYWEKNLEKLNQKN